MTAKVGSGGFITGGYGAGYPSGMRGMAYLFWGLEESMRRCLTMGEALYKKC